MSLLELTHDRRASLARYGKILSVVTIVWGGAEAVVALWSAARTHSVSLTGFGLDSVIEVLSALAVWWRMSHEMDHGRRHRAEHVSLRVTGYLLLCLAAWVFFDASVHLICREAARVGVAGIAITAAAIVCMPLLSREKRRIGSALSSNAMLTDSKQTDFCMYQAAIVLLGLLCRALFGINWTDGVAALILVPFLVRAGVLALRGEQCCAHH